MEDLAQGLFKVLFQFNIRCFQVQVGCFQGKVGGFQGKVGCFQGTSVGRSYQ